MVQSLLAVTSTLVVPAFRNDPMGAVSSYVEALPSALLSSHPVVPVAGSAWCRLIPMQPFRAFAVPRLASLLRGSGRH